MRYYPFGAQFCDGTADSNVQSRRYNGKEFDKMHGLNTYDYGARQYNPVTARWDRVDPLAEKYYAISPYVYCNNNPIRFIDPTGMDYWSTSDPKEIDTFLKIVRSTGLADANMEKWDHTSDADFIAKLSYNDKTQKFWYSSCSIENGEVVCTGKSFSLHTPVTLTAINSLGNSLKDNAGNSTIGNNGKFYWHESSEKGFFGNQYVETAKLAKLGSKISKVTGTAGLVLSGYSIYKGYQLDGGVGYNTVRATADAVGGLAGGVIGLKYGSMFGTSVCGFPYGTIIGGAIGGIAGSLGLSWGGTSIVDTVYGR
jgi:RHS repeat-associated protein